MPDSDATRPLRADARHNRALIIAATRELLAEQGAEVPLDQIAARAGVSIATFYRRFSDRTDLFTAVLLEGSEGLVATLTEIIALLDTDASRDTWSTTVHDLVVSAQSRLVPSLAIINSGLVEEHPDLVRAHETVRDLTRTMITRAQDAGLVRAELSPDDVVAMLFIAIQPVPNLSSDDNRALTSRTVQIVLAGLHPGAGPPIIGEPPRGEHQPDTAPPFAGSTTTDGEATGSADVEAADQGSKR